MISNVIFDMGGVLIQWDTTLMLNRLGVNGEDAETLRRQLLRTVEWVQQDRGVLDEPDLEKVALARLDSHLWGSARELVYWFRNLLFPVPGMAELVRELKGNGIHIYLLSNASHALREYFPRIPGAECFDGLMVSAEEGVLKPSQEIYRRLYQKFDLNPGECWFVDDLPANVEGAVCTGMRGCVFHGDVVRLRRELNAAGVGCKE